MPANLTQPARYAGYRFPTAVIHHALWLMNCFNFSLRVVQKLLLQRGIGVSHETLRAYHADTWVPMEPQIRCLHRPRDSASSIDTRQNLAPGRDARRGPRTSENVSWRAVDEHGGVLDILLQDHRDTDAAKRFFEKLIKDHALVPEKIITDQLGSYSRAWRTLCTRAGQARVREIRGEAEQSRRTGSRACQRKTTRVSRVTIPTRQPRDDVAVLGFHSECVQTQAGNGGGSSRTQADGVSSLG
jgi:putative transposase